ncbi:MAG TPA: tRNA pseudouridine(38-40) synthase TruA [Gammaproteobacteria bacterium]|jgi:tRNA pseudouridine38-40 synthase|nr:tRNA pseudouridine(38-40) synthase TruA [Gammaproteobacteria bacterium]
MPRIALGLEYDGTDFVGWQIQQAGRSVEGVLADAVSRVAGERVTVHGSGRTDAGVHALHQVAHFDARATRTPRQWLLGVNSNLPPDVAVRWVREVPPAFDARRSARSRRYRYSILQQGPRPALARQRVWWVREPLDCAAMTAAATSWLGEHDFSSFRAAGCQARSPNRRLLAVQIARRPWGAGTLVTCEFTANAFLQHMVRNLVGTLVAIGRGELPPSAAAEILALRDRTQAGEAAPPAGLALVEVLYEAHYALPRFVDEA